MTRERWSTLVRWAGMMAASGLLLVVLSARAGGAETENEAPTLAGLSDRVVPARPKHSDVCWRSCEACR